MLLITLVVILLCEPIEGDGWGHYFSARQPMTWDRFVAIAKAHYEYGNPRWGQVVLIAMYHAPVVAAIVAWAILGLPRDGAAADPPEMRRIPGGSYTPFLPLQGEPPTEVAPFLLDALPVGQFLVAITSFSWATSLALLAFSVWYPNRVLKPYLSGEKTA